jgi:hypothetical protein
VTVLEFPPIASSARPTSCLCTECNGSGRVALLFVVPKEERERRPAVAIAMRGRQPSRRAGGAKLFTVRLLGEKVARADLGDPAGSPALPLDGEFGARLKLPALSEEVRELCT